MVAALEMKIMIVEVEENSRVMLVNLLKGQGHTVLSALNGKNALELLKDFLPELVITDILMPEVDGFDLCRKMKSNPEWAHIPLIFYTATYTSRADKELGMLMGASRFIIKPQEPDILIELINDVISKMLTMNLLLHKYQCRIMSL
jgi:two-component system, cell cycle sensor histidine kinase and response regulator CckA